MQGSLQRRLLLAAAAWIVLALLLVALLLGGLFRRHVEQELAQRMQVQLDDLTAALVVQRPAADAAAGGVPAVATTARLALGREPAEPQFRQPYSGLYWAVQGPGDTLLRSRSLWDHPLDLPWAEARPGATSRVAVPGPRGQSLVFWLRQVQLPGLDGPVTVATGADVSHLERLTRSYGWTLATALGLLALVLIAAAGLQVRLGLAPMRALRGALARLRNGQAQRVDGQYPSEVQPLVDDLNALLADNAAIVDNARHQTGNLAHALKTPLAVLGNATAELAGPEGELLRAQLAQMHRQVELHLVRARAAAVVRAAAHQQGPGTPLRPVVDELLRTLGRLHAERALQVDVDAAPGAGSAAVRADAHELHEMLGNLLDNACQWARGRVNVGLALQADGVAVTVDDDGPGIPAEQRAHVLQRGRRLDERRPGTGLGLAIVDDLAGLHGGRLTLGESPHGGLRARLLLPLATGAAAPHFSSTST